MSVLLILFGVVGYTFLGTREYPVTDSPIVVGAIGLLVLNIALWALCYSLLKRGWKIKN